MPRFSALLASVLMTCSVSGSAQIATVLSLMPQPRHLVKGEGALAVGTSFAIHVQAAADDAAVRSAVARLQQDLVRAAGHPVAVDDSPTAMGGLAVVVGRTAAADIGADESYSLVVNAAGARLEASTSLGALRGLATLRQLISGDGEHVTLPAVQIDDAPLYAWRGVMIDCSRHFVPIDILERTLDAMELTKLNVLHLHLSDNEGFRVESKVFPDLAGKGSKGEFYTQDQLRTLIHDAALRGIVVVPEFDMPSHAKSWFAGYPDLSSSPGPFTPGPLTFDNIPPNATAAQIQAAMATALVPAFDPSRESTYEFLDRFIGEMTTLFPAPWLHIGADENNGVVWLANPAIVAFMKEHHLADAPALQAYFVDRVHALAEKHGRTMVAWEEAYAPGVKAGGVYQVWSPMAQVDLLKTPMPPSDRLLVSKGFYIDLFYPAYAHYVNDALPAAGPNSPALLGGEAAMWTEIADRTNIEARMWPRTGAIAERLWTPGMNPDPDALYPRLFQLSAVLDREGLHNLVDYNQGVAQLAAAGPVEPVRTLLDVLTPLKGYKRLMSGGLHSLQDPAGHPLDQAADVALVDSAARYQFRTAVAAFLAAPDAASAQAVRTWLTLWMQNDARLQPVAAQSPRVAAVAGHAQRLSALASFALDVLDPLAQGKPLTAAQLAQADELLKAAQTVEAQTELAVVPEFAGLFHGKLAPEPTSYPLF